MTIHPDDFRSALAQFASGITVVTTVDAQRQPLGLTVSSFCSVSLEPPLVLVCVDRASDTHPGFQQTGLFAVNVLAAEQEELSRRFAWGGPEKFQGQALEAGPHGLPLLPGALAQIECRVEAAHPAGDHVIYVGRVLSLAVRPGPPLVYHHSAYHHLAHGGTP